MDKQIQQQLIFILTLSRLLNCGITLVTNMHFLLLQCVNTFEISDVQTSCNEICQCFFQLKKKNK